MSDEKENKSNNIDFSRPINELQKVITMDLKRSIPLNNLQPIQKQTDSDNNENNADSKSASFDSEKE